MVEPPVLAVIGDTQVGKNSLLHHLPGFTRSTGKGSAVLSLDTKYYTASARVSILGGANPSDLYPDCEAVLLVFDSTREASFEFAKACARKEAVAAAEIKLCVATKIDQLSNGAVERSGWLAKAGEWCNEELYEYIEAAPLAPETDAQLCLDGEPQGMQRVRAALEAHTWPGLKMKSSNSSNFAASLSVGPDRASQLDKGTAAQNSKTASQPSQSSQAPLAERDSLATQAPDLADDPRNLSPQRDGELERDMQQFENLLDEVASARSRLQGLPDNERRTAAEALTMSLLSKFGLDEEFSESEGE